MADPVKSDELIRRLFIRAGANNHVEFGRLFYKLSPQVTNGPENIFPSIAESSKSVEQFLRFYRNEVKYDATARERFIVLRNKENAKIVDELWPLNEKMMDDVRTQIGESKWATNQYINNVEMLRIIRRRCIDGYHKLAADIFYNELVDGRVRMPMFILKHDRELCLEIVEDMRKKLIVGVIVKNCLRSLRFIIDNDLADFNCLSAARRHLPRHDGLNQTRDLLMEELKTFRRARNKIKRAQKKEMKQYEDAAALAVASIPRPEEDEISIAEKRKEPPLDEVEGSASKKQRTE